MHSQNMPKKFRKLGKKLKLALIHICILKC